MVTYTVTDISPQISPNTNIKNWNTEHIVGKKGQSVIDELRNSKDIYPTQS